MKKIILAILLFASFSSFGQKNKAPKYKLIWCDTSGHILGVTNENSIPKNRTTILLNSKKMYVLGICHLWTKQNMPTKPVAIYLVKEKK